MLEAVLLKIVPVRCQYSYLNHGSLKVSQSLGTQFTGKEVCIHPRQLINRPKAELIEFQAFLLPKHVVLERKEGVKENPTAVAKQSSNLLSPKTLNSIQLSVFAHRFMSIAEQIGSTLQRTSISPSIKERLDFSCAVVSPEGKLVANAPYIPIHLGSMQFAIQAQHKHWAGMLKDGDVLMTNHPQWGGTHLPDITVVTPIFIGDNNGFYVASRGHHTDIGGKGINSMMPESRALWQEYVLIKPMRIVSDGQFLEDDVRAAFEQTDSFRGCSMSRRLADKVSDLEGTEIRKSAWQGSSKAVV